MIGHLPAQPVRRRYELAATIALGLVAILAIVARIPSIAEPLGIDQSLWASAVRGMSRGQLLYQDVWEQRPPGIYWIYLAGFSVLGWTASTVAWLDVLASAATAALLFVIGRALADRFTGALAAALYGALTMPAWLYGYAGFLERSVCETFIVVCAAAGFWSAIRLRDGAGVAHAALLGAAAGAAIVLKPNAGIYFPAALVWLACYTSGSWRDTWRAMVKPIAIAIAASAVLPLVALVWLWQSGSLGEARVAVLDFNRFYVAEGFVLSEYVVAFPKAVFLRMKTDPLWLAGTAGALIAVIELARARRLPPLAGLAVVWGAAAAIAIVVNGARLFNSYFINALPPLALMAAWLFAGRSTMPLLRRIVGATAAVLMLLLLVQRGYVERVGRWLSADLSALTGRMEPVQHLDLFGGYNVQRGYSARANAELADYVRANSAPDDRIYLFGINGAGVYFLADRLTAHRFLRVNFYVATAFPDPRFRLEAVARDLAERKPKFIIFERLHSKSEMGQQVDALQQQPVVVDLLGGYERVAEIEDFTVFRRME